MRWRSTLGRALPPLVAVVLTLGMIEAGLRLLPRLVPLGLLKRFHRDVRLEIARRRFLPNESVVWKLERDDGGPELLLFRPFSRMDFAYRDEGAVHTVVTDAQGFCNPPGIDYAHRERIDIIAIGDSFTWCTALRPEDTWPSQLAALLGRSTYDLGRPGIGPHEQIQILKRFGLAKRPAVVVMNFYEGNDLRDALRYSRYVHGSESEREAMREDARMRGDRAEHAAWLDNPLGRHSYAYNLLGVAVASALAAAAPGDAAPPDPRKAVDFRYRLVFPEGTIEFNRSNSDRDEVVHARELVDGEIQLDVVDDAMAAFAELARQHGFEAIVTYTPSGYTAYADFVEFSDPSLAETMSAYSERQRTYLARLCRRLGLHFLDATAAMQQAARDGRGQHLLYFPDNVHFTPAGAAVLARLLAADLGGGAGR